MDRKEYLHMWIRSLLKDTIRCAKQDNKLCANSYLDYLQGILFYTESVGDISEETYNRVNNLCHIIRCKYFL